MKQKKLFLMLYEKNSFTRFLQYISFTNRKNKKNNFVHLLMLLQLENTNKENINKLLNFAKQNHLQLSLIDDNESNYFLPVSH
jgi:hypothetical protein